VTAQSWNVCLYANTGFVSHWSHNEHFRLATDFIKSLQDWGNYFEEPNLNPELSLSGVQQQGALPALIASNEPVTQQPQTPSRHLEVAANRVKKKNQNARTCFERYLTELRQVEL